MRRRRDPFARETYIPIRHKGGSCHECGSTRPVYDVKMESDGGRIAMMRGGPFCSWGCAEMYHGGQIGRSDLR